MNSQLNAELMRQKEQATGQAYGQAFTQGMNQFNAEQQQGSQLASMLAGAGAAQRDIEQQGIAAQKGQFEEERKFPYAQLQFQQSLLQGLPIGTTSYTPNLTGLQSLAQTGVDIGKIYSGIGDLFNPPNKGSCL
jgi:hypothetical protein